ncbi:unnamed protein product [Parajaminaea phylloscopi]
MISSLAWVKKGAAARHPSKFNISDDAELDRIQKLTNLEFGDAQQQLEEAKKAALEMGKGDGDWQDEDEADSDVDVTVDGEAAETKTVAEAAKVEPSADTAKDVAMDEDDLAKYNLDTYDEEESTGIAMGAFSNIKGLTFYKSNEDDPYITLKDDKEDEDEDREALEVLPSDNLLISAKTEDEVSLLEAHVYASVSDDAPEGSSLYVHHDLLLPSFPLCLEWVGHAPATATSSKPGQSSSNFLAVTTMEPEVELWNMDVIDGLVPDVVLGNREATKNWEKEAKKKGTGKKKRKIPAVRPRSALYHTDSVLSVSWNPFVPNLLISSSADGTIKLWDIDSKPAAHGGLEAMRSFEIHDDKVQSVAWNTSGVSLGPREGGEQHRSVVASGGYDGKVKVFDVRLPSAVTSIAVAGEIEKIRWNPWRRENLLVSLDSGLVVSYDVDVSQLGQTEARLLWTLSAHESACTSVDVSPHLPGCILTAGLDRQTKVWNLEGALSADGKPKQITLVSSRDLGAGKVFSASFSPDDVLTVAAAGSSGSVKVWNALNAKGVAEVFSTPLKEYFSRTGATARAARNAEEDGTDVVEVQPDEEEDEDEDEDEEAVLQDGDTADVRGDEAMTE